MNARFSNWPMVLLGLSSILGMVGMGCGNGTKAPSASTMLQLEGYTTELDRCRAMGKDAGSYQVYEDCAQRADARYGRVGR